jgi:ABC-2 type transport system permease protein
MRKARIFLRNLGIPFFLLMAINLLSYFFYTGIDLTAEKRFTLSPSTRLLLEQTKDPFTLTVYLDGDMPAGFKRLAATAKDMGAAFSAISKGSFRVVFERPGNGLQDSAKAYLFDSLQRMGIQPTNVKAQARQGEKSEETLVFPGAILSGPQGQLGIDFLQGQSNLNGLESLVNAEALMEYKLAKAVHMMLQDSLPAVAYLTGNGEPLDMRVYDLVEMVLRKNFRFSILPIDSVPFIPEAFDAVVMVKPMFAFSAAQQLKLDQYIVRGGKVLWAIDQLYASMDSLQRSEGSFVAFDMGLGLDEQLFRYGVRINRDLVQDLESDKVPSVVGMLGNQPQIELLPWPYSPLLRSTNGHPIARNLDFVYSSFPQSIDTVSAPGIEKHVLLSTSAYARALQTPAVVQWQSIRNEEDLRLFDKKNLPVGVLLKGRFRSAFENRLGAATLDQMNRVYGRPFVGACETENQMVVLADADILLNAVSERDGPLAMGENSYTRQRFANRDFIDNCLFYLTGGAGIMEARAKTFRLRLLDKGKLDADQVFWQFLNLLLPVALLFVFLPLHAFFRKRKFTQPT